MLRSMARPLAMLTRPVCRQGAVPVFVKPAWQVSAPAATRALANSAPPMKKPKHEDGTLEGRYATALFMASSDRIERVYNDLSELRTMMDESPEFKLLIETPGIAVDTKVAALQSVCEKIGADDAIGNFMKVLVENKRISKLHRIIGLFETMYRTEKGFVLCKVTSAEPLSNKQQGEVKSAMEKRAEPGSTLIMEYNTNPTLLGGLVVAMGEAVLDNSVSTRLERLQLQLLAPLA